MTAFPEETLRLFTAIEIPEAAKAQLSELITRLQKGMQFTGSHPTWVHPENLHLTLSFLGNQTSERVPDIITSMQAAASVESPFILRLSGLELFPTPREPRVISVAVRGQVEKLERVYNSLSSELGLHGFTADVRPFRAHLTLARIKSVKGLAGLRGVVKSHESVKGAEFLADAITLFQSTLASEGPTYKVLSAAPFSAIHSSAVAVEEPPPSAAD